MVTSSTTWECYDPCFVTNVILAQAAIEPYVIPMFQAGRMRSLIPLTTFNIKDSNNRLVTVCTDLTRGRLAGRMLNVCSTETQKVSTKAISRKLSLRIVAFHYDVSGLTVDPSYGTLEDISNIYPEVRDTNTRQIEECIYKGYTGVDNLEDVEGLNGLRDIGVEKTGGVTTPIDPTDYESLCKFFMEGINDAQKGNVTTGYEFSRSDIEVHVGRQLVDAISCSVLANTAIGLWDQLQSSVLQGNTVIVSEQIGNDAYFINTKRVRGEDNGRAEIIDIGRPGDFPLKTRYHIGCGTVSVIGLNDAPVIWAEDVVDLS